MTHARRLFDPKLANRALTKGPESCAKPCDSKGYKR